MELNKAIEEFLTSVLEELSFHPFIAPYLNTREDPPQPYIHQYEVIARLALRKPIRVLIGDEIGLGKTITALIIAKYLEKLNRGNRFLIIVPRVLIWQWHKELLRMGIPSSKIKHLESNTLDFLKLQNFPIGYYIASMDLLKKEERINEVAEVSWDLVIIDEAHKFGYKTERFGKIGKRLVEAKPGRDVVFLSATPHRGDPQDYISRLQLLDPYLMKGWKELDRRQVYEVTHGAILFRRTKEDVNKIYEGREIFPPARFYAGVINARKDEVDFVGKLVNFLRSKLVEFAYEKGLVSERVIPLLTVLIFKRAASSPYAAITTLERLLLKRIAPNLTTELIDEVESFFETGIEDFEYERDPEEIFYDFLDATSPLLSDRDKKEIIELRDLAKAILEKGDSKLNALISLLEDIISKDESKVIVFTEYKDTLKYLVENLKKKHPEWAASILRLSSDETRDEEVFKKIRDAFERNPKARILIATDVVAEGVNLQVANILVNYEVPWSLVKLEQRIGRIWRLGQKRNVEAYTLFMGNVADLTALNSMYEKLINLKKATLSPRPITGQEVLLYAESDDLIKIPPSVTIIEKEGKKKFIKITEAKAILTYLEEDRIGLERLIASIVAAKQEMEKELISKSVLYKPKTREEVERSIELLGFKNPLELFESLKGIVRESSEFLGYEAFEELGSLKITRGSEMPLTVNSIDDVYGLLRKSTRGEPIGLVAYGGLEGRLIILPIQVKDKKSGIILYKELIGVHLDRSEIFRGAKLFNLISQALSHCLGVVEWDKIDLSILQVAEVLECIKKSTLGLLEPLDRYISSLRTFNLRDQDEVWIKQGDLEIIDLKPIGFIHFVKPPKILPEIPREVKIEIEEKAIKIAMEWESKEEKRIPTKVPNQEHYDIKSIDPSTNDVRFIEVKGHKGSEIYGELTDEEFKFALEKGDKYWLYIIYNIGTKEPKMLRFKDPLKTMNWKIFERIERKRRYLLWPRNLEGVEIV
jgi:superfamily II DNA or RNA helicase